MLLPYPKDHVQFGSSCLNTRWTKNSNIVSRFATTILFTFQHVWQVFIYQQRQFWNSLWKNFSFVSHNWVSSSNWVGWSKTTPPSIANSVRTWPWCIRVKFLWSCFETAASYSDKEWTSEENEPISRIEFKLTKEMNGRTFFIFQRTQRWSCKFSFMYVRRYQKLSPSQLETPFGYCRDRCSRRGKTLL